MLTASFKKYILQFIRPAGTSRGVMQSRDSWFVFVSDNNFPDRKGIGEIGPLPGLSCEFDENFQQVIRKTCDNINEIHGDIHQELLMFPSIRFGFETALADLISGGDRILFPSLFTNGRAELPINGLIWMGDFDYMFQQLSEKIKQGFGCIKIKIGAIEFEEELKLISHIRKQFSPEDIEIRVDANGAFAVKDAKEKLNRLADFHIHSIEQPIKSRQWHKMAGLCETSPIPIALDEELLGVHETDAKEQLLKTIRPHYIILKPGLIGGFRSGDEWIKLAEAHNTGWWITSALESNIGLNAIAQWTFMKNVEMPQGLGTGMLYSNNIPSPLEIKQGGLWYNRSKMWGIDEINA